MESGSPSASFLVRQGQAVLARSYRPLSQPFSRIGRGQKSLNSMRKDCRRGEILLTLTAANHRPYISGWFDSLPTPLSLNIERSHRQKEVFGVKFTLIQERDSKGFW
eukprot:587822-Amphidinium_carterae.1